MAISLAFTSALTAVLSLAATLPLSASVSHSVRGALSAPDSLSAPVGTLTAYVSTTGSDATGDGSSGNPYLTIQKAVDTVDPGGVVFVAPGSYADSFAIQNPISLQVWGSGRPVIGPLSVAGVLVSITGADDVTITGFDFQGADNQLGIRAQNGSDRVVLNDCAFRDLGAGGIEFTGVAAIGHQLNDCKFSGITNSALTESCVLASGVTNLRIRDCEFASSDFGLRIWSAPQAIVEDSTFTDLRQSAIVAVGSDNLLVEDCCVTRCVELTRRTAWATPADQLGAISLATFSNNATLRRVIIEDCGGFTGKDSFRATAPVTFDGLFGIGILDSNGVLIEGCSIHRNEFGGVYVDGTSSGLVITGTNFVANGSLNAIGKDVGLYVGSGAVNATNNWWGVPTGPAFDGTGPANGILGSGSVTSSPFSILASKASTHGFVQHNVLPGGPRPSRIVCADFDADGMDDIAVVEDKTGQLVVQMRNGNNYTPSSINVGGELVDLVTGQFNADTDLDLAVIDTVGDRVVIFFGDGSGAFPTNATLNVARRPERMRAGDVVAGNGDDLVVCSLGDIFHTGGLVIYENDGAGNFTPKTIAGVKVPADVELMDLTSNGRLDIVCYDIDAAAPKLKQFFNLGGGNFTGSVDIILDPAVVVSASLEAFHFNGGGIDLAVASYVQASLPGKTTIRLLRNSGIGTLLAPSTIYETLGHVSMTGAHFGKAARGSLVVSVPAENQVIAFGSVQSPVSMFVPYASVIFNRSVPLAVGAGELTDDGAIDLVIGDANNGDLEIWRSKLETDITYYGHGCSGVQGIPEIRAVSIPEIGASTFGVACDKGAQNSVAALLISFLPDNVPLAGGCDLFVYLPFDLSVTTDANGAAFLPMPVSNDPALLNGKIFAQWFLLDDQGAFFNALSSTGAIEILMGG